jgi:hypothetical protein
MGDVGRYSQGNFLEIILFRKGKKKRKKKNSLNYTVRHSNSVQNQP